MTQLHGPRGAPYVEPVRAAAALRATIDDVLDVVGASEEAMGQRVLLTLFPACLQLAKVSS